MFHKVSGWMAQKHLRLCPICLRKLTWLSSTDILDRWTRLFAVEEIRNGCDLLRNLFKIVVNKQFSGRNFNFSSCIFVFKVLSKWYPEEVVWVGDRIHETGCPTFEKHKVKIEYWTKYLACKVFFVLFVIEFVVSIQNFVLN